MQGGLQELQRTVMGEVYFAAGKLKQALQTWDGAMRLAHEVGDVSRHLELIILRAETLIALGDWQQAAALMFDALELAKEVSDPVAVRYAYTQHPAGCNLYNKDGLPALPFRTDAW